MSNKQYAFSLEQFAQKTPAVTAAQLDQEINELEALLLKRHEERRFARSWEATREYIMMVQSGVEQLRAMLDDMPATLHDLNERDESNRRLGPFSFSTKIDWHDNARTRPVIGADLTLSTQGLSNVRKIAATMKLDPRPETDYDYQSGLPRPDDMTEDERRELLTKWIKSAERFLVKVPVEMRS